MAVKIAPDARRQFINASGVPYAGAKLFYYAAGSSTKQTTYTTSAGNVANSNPIILDSAGRTPYGVWFTEGLTYKEVLAPSNDTDPPTSPIFTEDGISGVNDTNTVVSQWVSSGLTPTYVSATSFTVPGDNTSSFHVGRRLKLTVTAGTVYGRITASAYTTLTTVTVALDSGSLDSGLTSVEWSLLSATNPAIPKLSGAAWDDLGVVNDDSDQTVAGVKTFTSGANILGKAGSTTVASGYVGEILQVNVTTGSAIALTTGVSKSISSLSLTAGKWEIAGWVNFNLAATTQVSSLFGGASLVDNTPDGYQYSHRCAAFAPGAVTMGYAIPVKVVDVDVTTTAYLVATAGFTTSTCAAWGYMRARRVA